VPAQLGRRVEQRARARCKRLAHGRDRIWLGRDREPVEPERGAARDGGARAADGRQIGDAPRDLEHAGAALVLALGHPQPVVVLYNGAVVEPECPQLRDRRSGLVARGGAAEAHQQAPGAVAPVHVQAVRLQRPGGERARRVAEQLRVVAAADSARRHGRQRVQSHGDAHDQPERAHRAGEELAEVIARDVLDHLAAGASQRAVRERDARADDEIAHAAVAVAQRARVVGGHDPADRRVDS
jgi:hypothetical protein